VPTPRVIINLQDWTIRFSQFKLYLDFGGGDSSKFCLFSIATVAHCMKTRSTEEPIQLQEILPCLDRGRQLLGLSARPLPATLRTIWMQRLRVDTTNPPRAYRLRDPEFPAEEIRPWTTRGYNPWLENPPDSLFGRMTEDERNWFVAATQRDPVTSGDIRNVVEPIYDRVYMKPFHFINHLFHCSRKGFQIHMRPSSIELHGYHDLLSSPVSQTALPPLHPYSLEVQLCSVEILMRHVRGS
jgi:hypothetical protein